MEVILKDNNKYILKFRKGEEVMSALKEFLKKNNIRAGYFSGLGALLSVEISFYNLPEKKYEKHKIEDVEVDSLNGNVAIMKGEPIVHIHGAFSGKDMSVLGGHVDSMVVGGAVEIHLEALKEEMQRQYDDETGLNLLNK